MTARGGSGVSLVTASFNQKTADTSTRTDASSDGDCVAKVTVLDCLAGGALSPTGGFLGGPSDCRAASNSASLSTVSLVPPSKNHCTTLT